ncbi:MAG: methyltransferase domain-containing protein [Proteobacteria bacterium]|nr:methyltransferase domain-containing protein [Pseudomonadota bacterium]
MFTERFLDRFGQFLPHYRANANQSDPGPVVGVYADALARAGAQHGADRTILEVGSGATNSVGYQLLQRGVADDRGRVLMYEPHAKFDAKLDAQMMRRAADPSATLRVQRITTLAGVADASVDLVLSNSVLEHVLDMSGLLAQLRQKMRPDGIMIHAVDYRDHFFKYPYHFLLFGDAEWNRWLNPGNLPRWRLTDHLRFFAECGLEAQVLSSETDPAEYVKVRGHLAARFDREDPATAVTRAVIACKARSTMQHP